MTDAPWPKAYPYGEMDPDYETDALARARDDVAGLLEGEGLGVPAGRWVGRVIVALIFCLLPGLGLLVGGVATALESSDPVWPAAIALFIFGALLCYAAVRLYLGAKPDTPRRALTLFYRSLGAGRTKRALRYVVPADRDAFPRFQPDVAGLGTPASHPYRFDDEASFTRFWNGLLRYHTAPYCIANLRQVRVRMIGADVAVVRFRLTLLMNTRLWLFLVIVALLVAVIIDVATRKTAHAELQKILVRVGDEWHLLDGGWWGPEEEDVAWLEAAGD